MTSVLVKLFRIIIRAARERKVSSPYVVAASRKTMIPAFSYLELLLVDEDIPVVLVLNLGAVDET